MHLHAERMCSFCIDLLFTKDADMQAHFKHHKEQIIGVRQQLVRQSEGLRGA